MFKGSVWGWVVPQNSAKIFVSDISTDIKNTSIVNLVMQKLGFWGSTLGGPRGAAPSNYVKVFVSKTSTADIKKHWHRKLTRSKNWFWGGFPSGAIPPNHAKIFVSEIPTDSNKHWHPSLSHSKIWFLGVHLEGGLSEVVPPNSVKLFASKYLLIWKYTGTVK